MDGIFHDETTGLDIYYVRSGSAHIFYADVSELCVDKVRSALSKHRIDKIDALKRDIDKKLSAGAECLLNIAISECYPEIKTPVEYKYGKSKKPELAGFDGVYFNMSHSGTVAVCVISNTEVGVDIELSDRISEGVINKYFTDTEKQMLKSNPQMSFAYIWTRKEAVVKAEGTGLSLGLSAFSVTDDTVSLNGYDYSVTSITSEIPGYDLALCQKLVSGKTHQSPCMSQTHNRSLQEQG